MGIRRTRYINKNRWTLEDIGTTKYDPNAPSTVFLAPSTFPGCMRRGPAASARRLELLGAAFDAVTRLPRPGQDASEAHQHAPLAQMMPMPREELETAPTPLSVKTTDPRPRPGTQQPPQRRQQSP